MVDDVLALPVLARGSYRPGSGKACIMNAISYMNGDVQITDLPACVWGRLARLAQVFNDHYCDLNRHVVRPGESICGPCSHTIWLLGARLLDSQSRFLLSGADEAAVLLRMLRAASPEIAGTVQVLGLENLGQSTTVYRVHYLMSEALGGRQSYNSFYTNVMVRAMGDTVDWASRPEFASGCYDMLLTALCHLQGEGLRDLVERMVAAFDAAVDIPAAHTGFTAQQIQYVREGACLAA